MQTGDLSCYYDNLLATKQTLIVRSLIRTSSAEQLIKWLLLSENVFIFEGFRRKIGEYSFPKFNSLQFTEDCRRSYANEIVEMVVFKFLK